MTTRNQQIQSAGHVLAEGYHPDDDRDLSALAARINAGDGWALVFSAPLDGTLRWQGVTFSANELVRVELRQQGWPEAAQ
jgi:hypothetical protein